MEGHAVTGHTYDRTIIQDNARAQLGDVHYHGAFNDHSCHTYIVYSASHYSSQLLRPYGPVSHETGESFSLKRKRCLDEKEHEKEQRLFKHTGESSLEKALKKLPKFSKRVKDQLKGPDAKKVVQQILAIIQAFQSNDLESHSYTSEDLESIDDCLRVARQVDINADFQRSGRSKLVRTTRRRSAATFGPWEILLTITTVKSRDEDGSDVIKSLYSLCLEPQSPAAGQPVQAYFGVIEHLGRTFLPPVVFAYRIIPNDSKVFEMIKQDDLQCLRGLIENGIATTRDCDEDNRSLLHYACYYMSVQCCKYLLEKGADIERLGRQIFPNPHRMATPLSECIEGLYEDPRKLMCSRLLLRAGADPTLYTHDSYSPLQYVMGSETTTYLDIICAEGGEFFDLRTYRQEHLSESPWLRASRFRNLPILQRLFSAGRNVAETNEDGHNCLLCFFCDEDDVGAPSSSRELEALLFLLRVFSDISARDEDGRTVFDHVDGAPDTDDGSYLRDLWYCALDRLGIEYSQHGANHPRMPTYMEDYTPEHHHALKYLDSWNADNFRSQMNVLLEKIPLSHEESLVMQDIQEERRLWISDWRRPRFIWEIISLGGQQIVRKRERKRG